MHVEVFHEQCFIAFQLRKNVVVTEKQASNCL